MGLIKKAIEAAEPKMDQIADEDKKLDATTCFELCK